MFYIFHKDKVVSYIITLSVVGILFLTASVFKDKEETIETSIDNIINDNIINNTEIENNNIIIE